MVIADSLALKVHVHTDDDQAAFDLFDGVGRVEVQEVTDMHEQIAARAAATSEAPALPDVAGARCGALAVVAGAGIADLLRSEGVIAVEGGATLNPSTEEILSAIEAHPAAEVVIMPNSKNVVLAAERAAELASKPAIVAGCLDQQAAVMAAIEFDGRLGATENAERLETVLGQISVGSVARAARDDTEGRFSQGDAVGFLGGEEPVAWGEPAPTLRSVAAKLAEGAEILTVLTGEGAPTLADGLGLDLDGVGVEIRDGGQPAYWWLLAAQ